MKIQIKNYKIVLILLAFALSIGTINAEANLQISSFSCSPEEIAINSVFSCTAQITNTGDAAAVLNTATLYPDGNNWLESSNYPQASGVTLNTSQSTEVTFLGLRATKSGNNGFSKIMLDTVERNDYVSSTEVNVINVAVSISNSASSAAMGGSVTSTAEVTAGGNINVVLAFAADSGGCSIGSQTNPITFNSMSDGNKQSKVWTITQGTSGNCVFTVSASATGTGGIASKIDSTSSTITCTNCPVASSSSSSGGGAGAGGSGAGGKVYSLGELISIASAQLAANEKAVFGILGENHSLILKNLTETMATIEIQSKKQTFVMVVGSSINADINEDNNADIKIRLDSINILTKKASFTLTRISGESAGAGGTQGATQGTGVIGGSGELNEREESASVKKVMGNIIYWIIGVIILITIIVIIIIIFKRKDKGLYYRKRYY